MSIVKCLRIKSSFYSALLYLNNYMIVAIVQQLSGNLTV